MSMMKKCELISRFFCNIIRLALLHLQTAFKVQSSKTGSNLKTDNTKQKVVRIWRTNCISSVITRQRLPKLASLSSTLPALKANFDRRFIFVLFSSALLRKQKGITLLLYCLVSVIFALACKFVYPSEKVTRTSANAICARFCFFASLQSAHCSRSNT